MTPLEDRIAAVRHFDRFFTRQLGILREGLLHSPYSLTEARILFELAQREQTATELARPLGLDMGYLSRIMSRFEQQGLVTRQAVDTDGRQRTLTLTEEGRAAFTVLDQRSRDEVAEMLMKLSEPEQKQLLRAMRTIEELWTQQQGFKYAQPFFLRQHEVGDMGWVIQRHAILYAQEYAWNAEFETLVAQIVAGFLASYNPQRERCWMAEMNGDIVGSVFVVQSDDERVAKLRLLLVEPKARGLGLGKRLVEECIRFARRTGYEKLTLWTNSVLTAARHIYAECGFVRVAEGPIHSFGHDLTEETWELDLREGQG
jgi:DNA-binding MarR family transcriptional regulator/N-acetylglutamate synthase-like GNAT family acetyltransferase